jgi:hypothetical protein
MIDDSPREDHDQVQDRLVALAARAPELPPNFAALVRGAARRRTRRRAAMAFAGLAAAAVVVAAGLPTFTNGSDPGPQPAATALTDWPARGPLVGQSGLTAEVTQAWARDGVESVSDVSLLYAGPAGGTRFVVARGTSADGTLSVGFFSSAATVQAAQSGSASPGPLWLRGSLHPAVSAQVLSIATNHLGAGKGVKSPGDGAVVGFALGAPGTVDLTVNTTTIDDQMVEGLGHRHLFAEADRLFPTSLAVTDTVIRWDHSGHQSITPVDIAGIGDPTLVAPVQLGRDGHLTVSAGTDAGVHIGDLVLSHDGLVARIDAATHSSSSALLVSDPRFTIRAVSDITNVRGQVDHSAGALRFVADDASSKPSLNRVVTATTPAVTIGFAGGGTTTPDVALTPAVTGELPATLTVLMLSATN